MSGTTEAKNLKLGKHIDNELLCCWAKNRSHGFYSFLYVSVFCLFRLNLCQFFAGTVPARIFKIGKHVE